MTTLFALYGIISLHAGAYGVQDFLVPNRSFRICRRPPAALDMFDQHMSYNTTSRNMSAFANVQKTARPALTPRNVSTHERDVARLFRPLDLL